METLLTALSLGIIAGITPGPLLSAGLLTIMKNPHGLKKVLPYPFIAGITEIGIAYTLLFTGQKFLNEQTLSILGVLGALLIFSLAYKVFSERNQFAFVDKSNKEYQFLSYSQCVFMTLFNMPLYIFWITVCLPLAQDAHKVLPFGNLLFVISMVAGVTFATLFLFFLMAYSRKILQKPIIQKTLPIFISIFFTFIGITLFFKTGLL